MDGQSTKSTSERIPSQSLALFACEEHELTAQRIIFQLFRHPRQMDNIYTSISSVPTSFVGANGEIRLSSVLCLMQDAASVHASLLGLGFNELYPKNRTFILSRTELKVCGKLPHWGERITLQTWPRGLERLYAFRDYELSLEGQTQPFLKASTAWLLIDTVNRRPVRPQDMFVGITTRDIEALDADSPHKLGWDEALPAYETRKARASDLDLNAHVNNTRYIDWIGDCVAQTQGLDAAISELCINYMGEIHPGEDVRLAMGENEKGRICIQGEGAKRNFAAELKLA